MRILVVEDAHDMNLLIVKSLKKAGYSADGCFHGQEALEYLMGAEYDAILLDIMMPKLDGFSACKEIKKVRDIPIIMLSARSEEYDKLFGFELGIDDYVVKPFSPKELMARINAVLTRKGSVPTETNTRELEFGGLTINIAARSVTVDGERVDLTPKEYDLLFYLVENRNIALSRDKLLSDIWGYDFFGDDRTIDTHIKNLRNNLGPYRDYIVTLRGVGYKFEV